MKLSAYVQSAATILSAYNGAIPFASWLKDHFRQHKKFGSRDRKLISDLCFSYFRLGKSFEEKGIEERLLIAQFLCNKDSLFVKELKPDWSIHSSLPVKERISFIDEKEGQSIFPLHGELSNEVDRDLFITSHLIQPDLFLRIRQGKQNVVIQKLESSSLPFSIEGNCVRLPNMSKVDEILDIDMEVVVQDKNSQKVLNNLLSSSICQLPTFTSWDCCAASGGKTILLHDLFTKAQIVVSDIRESILHNLRSRFKRAGIQKYQSFVADVSSSQFSSKRKYDVIICDAPCSGSGTWGRTPEQLSFFTKDKIEYYANLQKSIALNAIKYLNEGGFFLYITCSVFKKENEEVVDYISKKTSLKLINQQYFKGYEEKADTLFTALFSL